MESTSRYNLSLEAVKNVAQGDVYGGFFLMQALQVVNESSIRGLLDHVQNRILSFALELEARNPEAGEAVMNTPKIPEEQVLNVFNTTIKGDVQNVAQGSHSVSQIAHNVVSGNFSSLHHALIGLGVTGSDINKLRDAVAADESEGALRMGEKVKAWLGDMALKVGKGAITAGATAAVTEAVKQFFGS
jgi:hypothetical protein